MINNNTKNAFYSSSITLNKYQANERILNSHCRHYQKSNLCFFFIPPPSGTLPTVKHKKLVLMGFFFLLDHQPSSTSLFNQRLLKRQLHVTQVIYIIHWTNPGSNMQIAIMECWLLCHFGWTIDRDRDEEGLMANISKVTFFRNNFD